MFTVSFYRKQLLFFAVLAGLFGASSWLISNQTIDASGRPLAITESTNQLVVPMDLLDEGTVTVSGSSVNGVVSFLRDRDEFSYLVLDKSGFVIEEMVITLTFPRPVVASSVKSDAIVVHNATAEVTTAWRDPQTLVYTLRDLGPAASVTLRASFPKGTIEPSLGQRLFGTIRGLPKILWVSAGIVVPLITLIVLAVLMRRTLRERYRSASKGERPLPPEPLAPAVAAVLLDGRVSARAIAATLVDLARRDYVDIGRTYTGYTFTKRRRLLAEGDQGDLLPYEQRLLEKIFGAHHQASDEDVHVRIGSALFSRKVAEIYLAMYETTNRYGYFGQNPSVTQGTFRLIGLALFFLGLIGFGFGVVFFADPPTPLLFWIGVLLSALVVIALGPHTSSYTSLGARKRREWLEFRNYLTSTQPLDYAAAANQQFFTYLPYAISLGVEVEWARRFTHSPFHLPSWYASQETIVRLEDFANDVFPMVGFLAREMTAVKEPTLS